jgi:hypothetical protein
MTRKTILRALGAAVIAPLVAAGECASGKGEIHVNKPEKGHEDEEMHPEDATSDWDVDGRKFRELRISVWTDSTAWPYSVKVTATDHSDNEQQIKLGSHIVERGQFVCPIAFPAGDDVSVAIEVTCKQAPKRGVISTRERNARGGQISQAFTINGRTAQWNMSPRRRG